MEKKSSSEIPEIWGGIECTINRVGDQFKDQLEYSGHYDREGDIRHMAALGIQAIRYPVLWEQHQPVKNQLIDWRKTDQRLEEIRAEGLTPIVGLLHHGSGPSFTNLLDAEFPSLFADYAYEVANRYPWINYYTPVNEPLTTARFSGLYGLWYPHRKDESSFYRMLFHQLKATVLAMEAIRTINPEAKLVQTEDLGKTHSTPALQYQADFENERRLLSFDILMGLLIPGHPQYQYLVNCRISEKELCFFQEHHIQPDLIGLNYYITSERWLDERLEKYPGSSPGGNGKIAYTDTEMVRVHPNNRSGLKVLAREIWDRYQKPIAITEAHLHCTREDQMRWFKEIWDDAVSLRTIGVDIRAVTAWAMLGSFDWNTLLTQTGTQYESGVFDIQTLPGQLRPTALAAMIRNIRKKEEPLHPVLTERGWWHPKQLKENGNGFLIILGMHTGLFPELCLGRRLRYLPVEHLRDLDLEGCQAWALIDCTDKKNDLAFTCARNKIQYLSFSANYYGAKSLNISCYLPDLSPAQANKILDFLIDGEQGRWILDSDETHIRRITAFRENTFFQSASAIRASRNS